MYSQIIAAADPTPFNKPRFISWPSICDTTRTDWLGPEAPDPTPPSPALQNHVEYACMVDPRSDQPLGPRVLAACSSIDCIATPADPSYTFTAIAVSTWDPTLDIGPWTIDVGPGIPLPSEKPVAAKQPEKLSKKTGRPPLFDHIKRAEVCAMVRTGCSIRNAAQNAGVKMASIYYACRTDPTFAAQLRAAEQHRDLSGVRRINNAGEKSWRAAAWILERASPKHFSIRGANRTDTAKHLGKRRLRHLVADILYDMLKDQAETAKRPPIADLGLQAIEGRLAELEAQRQRLLDTARDDEDLDDDLDDDELADDTEAGEQGGVSLSMRDEEEYDDEEDFEDDQDFKDEEPADDDEQSTDEDDGPTHDDLDNADSDNEPDDEDHEDDSEHDKAAADAAYRRLMRMLGR